MSVPVMFGCGHWVALSGNEIIPRCHCGNEHIEHIDAPAPKFRGHVQGPCAHYEELPAKPVILKRDTNG